MRKIKALLKKDILSLRNRQKSEYKLNGRSATYLAIVKDLHELKYFKFMIIRYERKIRLKNETSNRQAN